MAGETPRTDDLIARLDSERPGMSTRLIATTNLARQLERELAQEREARKAAETALEVRLQERHALAEKCLEYRERAELAESKLAAGMAGVPEEPIRFAWSETGMGKPSKDDAHKWVDAKDYDTLRNRAAGMAKDAKRYRWLRDNMTFQARLVEDGATTASARYRRWYHDSAQLEANTLDQAIDSALREGV